VAVPGPGTPVAPDDKLPPPDGKLPKPDDKLPKPDDKLPKPSTAIPGGAKVIVELPADAKLYVMDRATQTTDSVRRFATPALEPGKTYFYDLRAEVIRDGKPVTETQRVLVRAGEVVRARFTGMGADESLRTARTR
jgi:uncharacterized protein (TIGR03000 family)